MNGSSNRVSGKSANKATATSTAQASATRLGQRIEGSGWVMDGLEMEWLLGKVQTSVTVHGARRSGFNRVSKPRTRLTK